MTGTSAKTPARATHAPELVTDPVRGRSRHRTDVSRDRDGWPQMQSRIPDRQVHRAMIGAMREPSGYLPSDWCSDITRDTSAYRSSYTVVYALEKEVS